MAIKAVFFDVGETLIDETRLWSTWADWLDIPKLTFFALLGAVIERGEVHRRVFDLVRPDFDYDRERAAQAAAGVPFGIDATDLYPDALPCLATLRAQGYLLGLAGNQPAEAEGLLRTLGLPVDYIATSAGWGVEKPSALFFARLIQEAGCEPDEIAYVGDRIDNDVLPARAAGLLAIFLHRGPWAYVQALRDDVAKVAICLESLSELPAILQRCEAEQ
jgi:FMN phosphatase YigB (HAD superfamily)